MTLLQNILLRIVGFALSLTICWAVLTSMLYFNQSWSNGMPPYEIAFHIIGNGIMAGVIFVSALMAISCLIAGWDGVE